MGFLFIMAKETFIVRTEWHDAINELDNECKAIILDNLFYFHLGQNNLINLNNLTVKLVWKLIEPNLIRNIESYDKRSETSSLNGKLGGRPKNEGKNNLNNLNKPIEKPNYFPKPIESLSDSVSVSVSDSVSEIDNKIEEPISFFLLDKILKSFLEKNKNYFSNEVTKTKDLPAIKIFVENICYDKFKTKNFTKLGIEHQKEILTEFEKINDWYFLNGKNRSLETLARFETQKILTEIKNGVIKFDKPKEKTLLEKQKEAFEKTIEMLKTQ